jgi:AcrR family transcriptional regulator
MEKNSKKSDNRRLNKMVKIGRAAAKLFNEKGYLTTNMDQIASSAKMSKGGIFHYFSSKDEILYFILNNHMDLILGGLADELLKITGSIEKIKFLIWRHIEIYTKNIPESRTLLQQGHLLRTEYKTIAEKERRYYQIVASVLSDVWGGPIRKEKLTAITFTLFGMCNWIYSWYNPKGAITPQELSEIIYRIFTEGIFSEVIFKRQKR